MTDGRGQFVRVPANVRSPDAVDCSATIDALRAELVAAKKVVFGYAREEPGDYSADDIARWLNLDPEAAAWLRSILEAPNG